MTSLIDTLKSINKDELIDQSSDSLAASDGGSASMQSTTTSTSPLSKPLTNIYWMLQDPIDEFKYKSFKNTTKLTNKQIDVFNRATISLIYRSPIKIWSSSRLAAQGHNKDTPDGLHLGSFVLQIVRKIN